MLSFQTISIINLLCGKLCKRSYDQNLGLHDHGIFKHGQKIIIKKHLMISLNCEDKSKHSSFSILDSKTTESQLKLKESLQIKCVRTNLNQPRQHMFINLSL